MDLIICKPFSLYNFVALFTYFWVFVPFLYLKKCVVSRKSSCPFWQLQPKMYLPESPLKNKNSLAKQVQASGQVLTSVPGKYCYPPELALGAVIMCKYTVAE